MNKNLAILLSLLLVVLTGIIYLYYRLNLSSDCSVSVVSNSEKLNVMVEDRKAFESFTSTYVPCPEGEFDVGDPYSGEKYTDISSIELNITDTPGSNTMTSTQDDGDQNIAHSWSYSVDQNKVTIYLQFSDSLIQDKEKFLFRQYLPYLMAARLDGIRNYQSPELWLDRKSSPIEDTYSLKNAGLKYEKL